MKVLVAGGGTGGHLMPALAIARALRQVRADVEPVLVGAERGVEARLLPARHEFPFYLLPVEPFYRRAWWRNARWFATGWRLWRACRRILAAERPRIAVSTGGYAAGPIVYFASRRGIPTAVQEQNAHPGLTSRWLAPRARQIHLGFHEARARLRIRPDTEVCTLGNPIAPIPEPRPAAADAKRSLGLPPDARACFVMGGSQGAIRINRAISEALDAGRLEGVAVLWSTGHGSYEEWRRHHAPPWRHVRPFWDPVNDAYAAADVAITRAGAMTIAELCAWRIPSILIPLPTAAEDHQSDNARALETAGAAEHLPEGGVAPELINRLRGLLEDEGRRIRMAEVAGSRGRPDAAMRIAERIATLLE